MFPETFYLGTNQASKFPARMVLLWLSYQRYQDWAHHGKLASTLNMESLESVPMRSYYGHAKFSADFSKSIGLNQFAPAENMTHSV